MQKIKFIYFEGCPNAAKVRLLLEEAGLPFESLDQNQLPSGHPFRGYSSPAVLVNEKLIYGAVAQGGGCSLEPFDLGKLKALISGA